MKHLTSQIVLIGSLSFCLTGLAQDKSDEKDVDFSVVPHIANINCGGDVRNATYTVKNQEEHATIFVDPVEELINHDNFPDDLVVVQDADAPGADPRRPHGEPEQLHSARRRCERDRGSGARLRRRLDNRQYP